MRKLDRRAAATFVVFDKIYFLVRTHRGSEREREIVVGLKTERKRAREREREKRGAVDVRVKKRDAGMHNSCPYTKVGSAFENPLV